MTDSEDPLDRYQADLDDTADDAHMLAEHIMELRETYTHLADSSDPEDILRADTIHRDIVGLQDGTIPPPWYDPSDPESEVP